VSIRAAMLAATAEIAALGERRRSPATAAVARRAIRAGRR
jgi:hypothetical protein